MGVRRLPLRRSTTRRRKRRRRRRRRSKLALPTSDLLKHSRLAAASSPALPACSGSTVHFTLEDSCCNKYDSTFGMEAMTQMDIGSKDYYFCYTTNMSDL